MGFKDKNIISIRDFSKKDLMYILDISKEFEKNDKSSLLSDSVLASLFFEPSTRTRLSFESAISQLGGKIIGFDDSDTSSVKKGESLSDTIKTVERYSDVIVMRSPIEGSSRLASDVTNIPVINAGDGSNQHPTQTLLDLYTIKKVKSSFDGMKIGFMGDLKYSRTIHSLITALKLWDVEMYFISDNGLQITDDYLSELDKENINYYKTNNLLDISKNLDILYVTRVQKERFSDDMSYEKYKDSYIIDKSTLKYCKDEIKI
ncbi:MAG: aspartate carbamoyltransferase, partial [Candidatus Woesearchaeota archaeon]